MSSSRANWMIPILAALLLSTCVSVWHIQSRGDASAGSLSAIFARSARDTRELSPEVAQLASFPLLEPGLFKIEIPEKFAYPPKTFEGEQVDTGGTLLAPYKVFSYNAGQNAYKIGYVRLPREVFRLKSNEVILNGMRDKQVSAYNGQLKKESTYYEALGIVRRELELHSSKLGEALYVRTSLVLSEPYAFYVSYLSNDAKALDSPKAQKFFSSFSIFREENPKTIVVSSGH